MIDTNALNNFFTKAEVVNVLFIIAFALVIFLVRYSLRKK